MGRPVSVSMTSCCFSLTESEDSWAQAFCCAMAPTERQAAEGYVWQDI